MGTPFRPALELLAQYARHHRDRRNILTHFASVPLLVFAAGLLGTRPALELQGWMLTPAWVAFALLAAWYLTRGLPGLGFAAAFGVGVLVLLAHRAGASAGMASWLAWCLACLGTGWLLQFLGHYYEGRPPAASEDPIALLVAPLFVAFEALSFTGRYKSLAAEIERRAGPTHLRDLAQPIAR